MCTVVILRKESRSAGSFTQAERGRPEERRCHHAAPMWEYESYPKALVIGEMYVWKKFRCIVSKAG